MALQNDGSIHHFAAVRVRVVGSGNLRMRLLSLSEAKEKVIVPIEMETSTDIEPTKGTNFRQPVASLEMKTTAIDEYFVVSKIVIFAKVSATGRPG